MRPLRKQNKLRLNGQKPIFLNRRWPFPGSVRLGIRIYLSIFHKILALVSPFYVHWTELSCQCQHFGLDCRAALDVVGHRRQHETGLVALKSQVTRLG